MKTAMAREMVAEWRAGEERYGLVAVPKADLVELIAARHRAEGMGVEQALIHAKVLVQTAIAMWLERDGELAPSALQELRDLQAEMRKCRPIILNPEYLKRED
jgi:hypothetical protein